MVQDLAGRLGFAPAAKGAADLVTLYKYMVSYAPMLSCVALRFCAHLSIVDIELVSSELKAGRTFFSLANIQKQLLDESSLSGDLIADAWRAISASIKVCFLLVRIGVIAIYARTSLFYEIHHLLTTYSTIGRCQ